MWYINNKDSALYTAGRVGRTGRKEELINGKKKKKSENKGNLKEKNIHCRSTETHRQRRVTCHSLVPRREDVTSSRSTTGANSEP